MADVQASFIKLSLEKYAGIVSVLSQGGDAAGLVSDVSSLKEVAKLNGLEAKAKTAKVELVQLLSTHRLGSAYIRMHQDVCSEGPSYERNAAPPAANLHPNDLIGLRWAVPSQALVNGVAGAPTLLDFAQGAANGKASVDATTCGVPMNKSVQQLAPMHSMSSSMTAIQLDVRTHEPQNTQPPPVASNQVLPQAHISALSTGQAQAHRPQSPLAIRPSQLQERTHGQAAPTQIVSGWHRGEDHSQGHRSLPQPSSLLLQAPHLQLSQQQAPHLQLSQQQAPHLQLSQQQAPQAAGTVHSCPVGQPRTGAAPAAEPVARAPPPPPAWLLQDMIELARSSSVATARPDTSVLKQRVAICFPEDHELSVPRRGKTVVKKGVYDGKVLQVLENAEHDEEQCPPACCLKHTFCTVKLSVPNHETRSQMIVEVCVDLPTRLQLGSFRAFATSEQVEDAWVLLSAGQSPELAMLTQMLATAQASQPPPNTAARVASKKLCKIPAPKRAKSGRNSELAKIPRAAPKAAHTQPISQHIHQARPPRDVLHATCIKEASPTTKMADGANTSAHKSGPPPFVAQQPSQPAALRVTDETCLNAENLDSVGGCAKTPEHVAGLGPVGGPQNAPVVQKERPAVQSSHVVKTGFESLQKNTIVPSQVKGIHNGWKKRKRPPGSAPCS